VRGGLEPVEQPCSAQQQRAGADRGGVLGVFVGRSNPVDHRPVGVGDPGRRATAGHQEDVWSRDLLECVVDVEVQLAVLVIEAAAASGAYDDLHVGVLGEHLVGADGVENRESGKEANGNLHDCSPVRAWM
jgi:hypothetical protein